MEASGCQAPCPDPQWTPAFIQSRASLDSNDLTSRVCRPVSGTAHRRTPPHPMSWHVVTWEGLGSKAPRVEGRLGPRAP